jgi:hypothetical protein
VGQAVNPAVLHDHAARPLATARKEGMRVARYVSDYAAVLRPRHATTQGRTGVMAMSTLPLRSRDSHGQLRSVDLSVVQSSGAFAPENSSVKVRIGARVGDGFLVSADQVGLVPLDVASQTPGTASGDAVFYANSETDADHIVQATPAGAESLVQLRSIRSPQRYRYRIDLPKGGALRTLSDGSIAVSRDGGRVGTIAQPVAWDADHQPVPVTTTLQGNVLVLDIAHRDKDVRYPLMLDPAYTNLTQYRWDATTPSDKLVNSTTNAYWQYTTNVSNKLAPVFNTTNANGAPNGLYSISLGAQVLYGGSYGYWRFKAPGNASVAQVEWTHMSHTAAYAGGPSPCIGYGIIYNSTAWKAAATDCFNFSSSYRRSCWDCNDSDGFSYDASVTGAQFGTEVYNTTAANLSDFLGQTTVYVVDIDNPTFTITSQPTAGWSDSPTGTFAVNATDAGVGVESMDVPGGGNHANTGCLYAGPCPPSMPGNVNVATLNLPEGDNSVTFTAYDASHFDHRDASGNLVAGQHQASAVAHVKVDHQGPTLSPSGSLYDARNGFVGDNQDYALNVTATDGDASTPASQRSGATAVTATLDDQPMTGGSVSSPCTAPQGSCSLTIHATLTAAQIDDLDDSVPHTIKITANDAVGHASTPITYTFKVDTTAPTSFSTGDLLKVSGSPLTEDTYHLSVQARDNDPTINEVDDDGTEVPATNQPGAGLRDLVVRVDGQSMATSAIACFDDPACEQARSWTWDTTGVSNGVHTVTITATDNVNNQDVDSFQVDVEHQPDEPARTNTAVERTILGANPADRAGNSVASVGDVNGDGHTDYLVGAPGVSTSGRSSAGAAYLVLGTADPSTVDLANPGTAAVRLLGPGSGQYCGTSVAAAGDVNGDGLNDMLIGCPGLDSRVGAVSATGRVYVIFGRTDPQDIDLANFGTAGFVVTGPTDTLDLGLPALTSRPTVFGERLQSASPDQTSTDVNDDGYDDIVIGDSAVTQAGKAAAGAAYVIYGKPDNATIDATALGSHGFTIHGALANSLTGYSTAITDDVTGDTTPDIIVGAPGTTTGVGGHAYVIKGDSDSDDDVDLANPGDRAITLTSSQTDDRFGVNVAALGDTDLDTKPDIAIGTSSGAYVLRTIPSTNHTVTADDGYRITGPVNDPGLLSTAVPEAPIAPAGDLDGDQRADLIIGYPNAPGNRAYTIRSPDASRTLNVSSLPGQRGAALDSGTQDDQAGAAVAASTYLGQEPNITENGQSITGAPNTAQAAGRAYITAEPTPTGPGVETDPDPTDAGPAGTSMARSARTSQLATAASTQEPDNGPVPGVYNVTASEQTAWVTVRNDEQAFVIGSAHDQDQLYADARKRTRGDSPGDGQPRKYLHGLFGKGVHRCGWIIQKQTVFTFAANPFPGRTCRGVPQRLSPYRFARLINQDGKGDGTTVRLRWIDSQAGESESQLQDDLPTEIPLYRNVRPGTHELALDPDGTLPTTVMENGQRVRTIVKWRYISKSSHFVMVRVSEADFPQVGHNGWVFISRAWLPKTFGPGSLCDDGTGTGPKPPTQSDWAPVCSHKASGYTVADHG